MIRNILLILLSLVMIGPSVAEIRIIDSDAARNFSLSRLAIDTDANPVSNIFVFNSEAFTSNELTHEDISTIARNRSKEFIFGQTASVRTTLSGTKISTIMKPLRRPFLLHQLVYVEHPLVYPIEFIANMSFAIIGVDSHNFPKIQLNFFINTSCATLGNLSKEDFRVEEDGQAVDIDNLVFENFKVTRSYLLEYTSPNLQPSTERTVTVTVNKPGCTVGEASISYTSP